MTYKGIENKVQGHKGRQFYSVLWFHLTWRKFHRCLRNRKSWIKGTPHTGIHASCHTYTTHTTYTHPTHHIPHTVHYIHTPQHMHTIHTHTTAHTHHAYTHHSTYTPYIHTPHKPYNTHTYTIHAHPHIPQTHTHTHAHTDTEAERENWKKRLSVRFILRSVVCLSECGKSREDRIYCPLSHGAERGKMTK